MQVAVFQNIRAVIRSEKICGNEGIKVTVMPLPEALSSECGMCLRIESDEQEFEQLMNKAGIPVMIYDKI